MILRLELPRLAAAVDRGVIAKWHKKEGEVINYGDDLCEVDVAEVARMRRRLGAQATTRLSKPSKPKFRTRSDLLIRYRLTSVEVGTLSEIIVAEGKEVRTGDLLALLLVGHDDSQFALGRSKERSPARVVVNLARESVQ
ncbi:MAG TPA: lipoyl domain-containing protein [Acidimicrobiia bacterium]|nr:lipoyl domain-containing protein [Acidimicrobiia bacterium]